MEPVATFGAVPEQAVVAGVASQQSLKIIVKIHNLVEHCDYTQYVSDLHYREEGK